MKKIILSVFLFFGALSVFWISNTHWDYTSATQLLSSDNYSIVTWYTDSNCTNSKQVCAYDSSWTFLWKDWSHVYFNDIMDSNRTLNMIHDLDNEFILNITYSNQWLNTFWGSLILQMTDFDWNIINSESRYNTNSNWAWYMYFGSDNDYIYLKFTNSSNYDWAKINRTTHVYSLICSGTSSCNWFVITDNIVPTYYNNNSYDIDTNSLVPHIELSWWSSNQSCQTAYINTPYNLSYSYQPSHTTIDDYSLSYWQYFQYNRWWWGNESIWLYNAEDIEWFTWSLSSTWTSFTFNSFDIIGNNDPQLKLHSDYWIDYVNLTWTWNAFNIISCDWSSSIERELLEYWKEYHFETMEDVCIEFIPAWFTENEIFNIDFWSKETQIIEREVCSNLDTDEITVDWETYTWSLDNIGNEKTNFEIREKYTFEDLNNEILELASKLKGSPVSFSWSDNLLLQPLATYWSITYKDQELWTCEMFDTDWRFLYTVNNIFHVEYKLATLFDNRAFKIILFVPDLILSWLSKHLNSLFDFIGSFWSIEDNKEYCFLWIVHKVEFQKYIPSWWNVIWSLESYKVNPWSKTVLDYMFLLIYWILYVWALILFFKPSE